MTHSPVWLRGREVELVLPGKTRRFRSRVLDIHVRPEDGLLLGLTLRKQHGLRTIYVDAMELVGRILRVDMSTDKPRESMRLQGVRVETVSGVHIGSVHNVSVDLLSKKILHISVWRRFLGLPLRRFLIQRQEIVDMKPGLIIVRDAAVSLPLSWFAFSQAKIGSVAYLQTRARFRKGTLTRRPAPY